VKRALIITFVVLVVAAAVLPILLHSGNTSSVSSIQAAGLQKADSDNRMAPTVVQDLPRDDQGRPGQRPPSREGRRDFGPPDQRGIPNGPVGGPQGPQCMPPDGPIGGPQGLPPGGPAGGPQGSTLRPPLPTLNSDQEKKAEEFVKGSDPAKFKDLQDLRSRDEKMYSRILAEVYMEMQFLEKVKKDNPALYQNIMEEKRLETACHAILRTIKDEKDASKLKAGKEELKKNLYKIFDLRQLAREEKIKRIEGDLQDLKKKNEMRKKNRESIVDYRLMEMIGRLHESDW